MKTKIAFFVVLAGALWLFWTGNVAYRHQAAQDAVNAQMLKNAQGQ